MTHIVVLLAFLLCSVFTLCEKPLKNCLDGEKTLPRNIILGKACFSDQGPILLQWQERSGPVASVHRPWKIRTMLSPCSVLSMSLSLSHDSLTHSSLNSHSRRLTYSATHSHPHVPSSSLHKELHFGAVPSAALNRS